MALDRSEGIPQLESHRVSMIDACPGRKCISIINNDRPLAGFEFVHIWAGVCEAERERERERERWKFFILSDQKQSKR